MMKLYALSCVFLVCCLYANPARSEPDAPPLFEQHSLLELGMKIDFDSLCRPRETPDCDYSASEISYMDGDEERIIPVEVRIRGGWRALKSNCDIPLLFIRFPDQDTEGTPFAGQSMLPLTTHCGRAKLTDGGMTSAKYASYEQYLLKEYLAYRLYEELTDTSLRVRLAKMSYKIPGKGGRARVNYAFFTEHFKSLAERQHAELLPRESFDHKALDTQAADRVALFEFMIGNSDWSLVRQRNAILLLTENGKQIPVPFDLDMSGLVNAPYAGPPPSLPIDEVTERYYLGYCHPDIDWDNLFSDFLSRQNSLVSQVDEIDGLYKRERRSAKRYLESFFDILQNPELRNAKIIEGCQAWPPQAVDHMAPEVLGR